MAEDISKKTVAILLVIAVIVSVIGTWTAMTQTVVIDADSDGQGQAILGVTDGKMPVATDTGSANAVLGVNK